MKNLYTNFLKVTNSLIDSLGINSERELITKSLFSSVYLVLLEESFKTLGKEKIKQISTSESEINTVEQFEEKVKEIENVYKETNFDYTSSFNKASMEVLNGFVDKIGVKLTDQKRAELKSLISQNF
ncbi:MAG: hypothetical protein AAB778_00065 [Patescibacteria group bacterium]